MDHTGPGRRCSEAVNVLRIHAMSALTTVAVWAGVAVGMGWGPLGVLVVLCLLEMVFSFDNAVVNAKLLERLSPFWQRLFLTVGMIVAVGVVRFALPVLIVAATAGLPVAAVVDLVLHRPAEYGQHLAQASPLIDSFGGNFLTLLALGFFADEAKELHWIRPVEAALARLGRYGGTPVLVMLGAALVMYFTVPGDAHARAGVLAAAVCGIALHLVLDVFGQATDGEPKAARRLVRLSGAAAAVMFMRLEVLDASFSFDGVIAAFAITTHVVLIAAGLGVGSLWTRSLTVHMVRAGTLGRFAYLEHGAHWAILALGVIMMVKVYGWHPPEAAVGGLGLVVVSAAVLSSMARRRRLGWSPPTTA